MGKIVILDNREEIYGECIEFRIQLVSVISEIERMRISERGWNIKDFFYKVLIRSKSPDGTTIEKEISPIPFAYYISHEVQKDSGSVFNYIVNKTDLEIIAENKKYKFLRSSICNPDLNIDLQYSNFCYLEDRLDIYLSNLNYTQYEEDTDRFYNQIRGYEVMRKLLFFMGLPMSNFNFKTHKYVNHNILFIPKIVNTSDVIDIKDIEKQNHTDSNKESNYTVTIPTTFMVVLSKSILDIDKLLSRYDLNLEGDDKKRILSSPISESMIRPLNLNYGKDITYLEVTLDLECVLCSKYDSFLYQPKIILRNLENDDSIIKNAIKNHISQFSSDNDNKSALEIIDNIEFPQYLEIKDFEFRHGMNFSKFISDYLNKQGESEQINK